MSQGSRQGTGRRRSGRRVFRWAGPAVLLAAAAAAAYAVAVWTGK